MGRFLHLKFIGNVDVQDLDNIMTFYYCKKRKYVKQFVKSNNSPSKPTHSIMLTMIFLYLFERNSKWKREWNRMEWNDAGKEINEHE